jgi:hypothetical protein
MRIVSRVSSSAHNHLLRDSDMRKGKANNGKILIIIATSQLFRTVIAYILDL